MELAHGLIIGGTLLVATGSIGMTLQRRLAITDPISMEQDQDDGAQEDFLPKFLPDKAA
jgi:hypothetical protein